MVFWDDTRAQSIQIGAVLLFGILVIAFSMHQAYVIPNQNRQVEFNHFADTQNEMEGFRNSVIRAGETGETVPTSIQLGTTYPPRLVGAQPSSSSGTFRTATIGSTELGLSGTDAEMGAICGLDDLTTKFGQYQPEYNYLSSVENISYENTVVYTNGAGAGRAFQTDQQLVVGNTIQLYPLLGEYNQGGRSATSVTLRGGTTGVNSSVEGPFTLTLPTRLSAAEWDALLSEQDHVQSVNAITGQQAVEIEFEASTNGDYTIRCSPTGIGRQPNNEPSVTSPENNINPNFGNDVVLRGTDEGGADNEVGLVFENTNSQYQNLTRIRFPFYSPAQQGGSGAATLPGSFEYDGTTVERVGKTKDITDIDFAPNGEPEAKKTVNLRFYCGKDGAGSGAYSLASGDYFVITAFFEGGKDRTYFVSLTDSGSSGGNRCGGSSGTGDTGSSGGSSLSTASVSDIGSGSAESQTLEFTLDRDYSAGEEVTINLNDPQKDNQVDYQNADTSVSSDGGNAGTITTTTSSNQDYSLTYTATNGGSSGDTITITLDSVDATGSQADKQDPYSVEFTGPDGDTITKDFTVG